jgi:hypothetical protein
MPAELNHTRQQRTASESRLTELEEDVAAARTALRRMICKQTADVADEVDPDL